MGTRFPDDIKEAIAMKFTTNLIVMTLLFGALPLNTSIKTTFADQLPSEERIEDQIIEMNDPISPPNRSFQIFALREPHSS